MPVDKPDYDEIRRYGQTFTVVVNEVIEGMSMEAIAVYVYLLSKPQDWTIRPKEVRSRFNIGDHTWRRIAKELRERGVLFDQIERDGDGRVTSRILYIGSQPIDSLCSAEKRDETSIPLKINDTGTVPLTINDVAEQRRGSSTPLQSKDSLQSIDIYKGRFAPPSLEDVTEYCRSKGYTFDPESFVAYHTARGWKLKGNQQMKCWKSACTTFQKNEDKWNPKAKDPRSRFV